MIGLVKIHAHGTGGYARGCRCETCRIAYRAWHNAYRRHPGRAQRNKERTLRENWGLTQAQLEAMITAQGGRCKICQGDLAPYFGKGTRTQIDHDHREGKRPRAGVKIRGILCHLCNQGLGKFRDDPDRLIRAAQYVRQGGAI